MKTNNPSLLERRRILKAAFGGTLVAMILPHAHAVAQPSDQESAIATGQIVAEFGGYASTVYSLGAMVGAWETSSAKLAGQLNNLSKQIARLEKRLIDRMEEIELRHLTARVLGVIQQIQDYLATTDEAIRRNLMGNLLPRLRDDHQAIVGNLQSCHGEQQHLRFNCYAALLVANLADRALAYSIFRSREGENYEFLTDEIQTLKEIAVWTRHHLREATDSQIYRAYHLLGEPTFANVHPVLHSVLKPNQIDLGKPSYGSTYAAHEGCMVDGVFHSIGIQLFSQPVIVLGTPIQATAQKEFRVRQAALREVNRRREQRLCEQWDKLHLMETVKNPQWVRRHAFEATVVRGEGGAPKLTRSGDGILIETSDDSRHVVVGFTIPESFKGSELAAGAVNVRIERGKAHCCTTVGSDRGQILFQTGRDLISGSDVLGVAETKQRAFPNKAGLFGLYVWPSSKVSVEAFTLREALSRVRARCMLSANDF